MGTYINSEWRRILYRVSMRCAVEWGSALARVDQENSPPHLSQQPFESEAWHAYIMRLAVQEGRSDADYVQFEKELKEQKKPTPEVQAIPARLIL